MMMAADAVVGLRVRGERWTWAMNHANGFGFGGPRYAVGLKI